MRRWSTALIVVAVAALAVFAAADALRGHGQPRDAASVPATTRERAPTLRERLRSQGVSGQILYSDQDCILHSLVLPQMVDDVVRGDTGARAFHYCRFGVGGGRIRDDDELISPDGQLVARCRAGHVEVFIESGERRLSRVPGCAPAWRPDGGLTYARNGEILLGGGVVLISTADLRRAANRHPNVRGVVGGHPVKVGVTALAWFDERRLAAALRIRILGVEPQYLLVVFEGRRVVASAVRFTGPLGALVTSPAGSYVADEGGMIMARNGVATDIAEGLPNGRVVTFSPDDRWVLLVTRNSIYLVATPVTEAAIRTLRLPVDASDAVWEPGGPTIDTTTTAR
jgi:hypothetical protein